jgi:hypothetical protein
MHVFLFFPIHSALPVRLIICDLIIQTMFEEEQKLQSSPIGYFLNFPDDFSPLGQNIFLTTLLSNFRSLCSSLNTIGYTTFHTDKNRQNYSHVLYLSIFMFLHNEYEDKSLWRTWSQEFPELNLLVRPSYIQFWYVGIVLKYLNFVQFSYSLSFTFMRWLCFVFCSWDKNIYLDYLSTYYSTNLPATNFSLQY